MNDISQKTMNNYFLSKLHNKSFHSQIWLVIYSIFRKTLFTSSNSCLGSLLAATHVTVSHTFCSKGNIKVHGACVVIGNQGTAHSVNSLVDVGAQEIWVNEIFVHDLVEVERGLSVAKNFASNGFSQCCLNQLFTIARGGNSYPLWIWVLGPATTAECRWL